MTSARPPSLGEGVYVPVPSLAFLPILRIDSDAARIHAFRCLRREDTAGPSATPWNALTLAEGLRAVSALPFELDFFFTVGPGRRDTETVLRELAAPATYHPIRLSRLILEVAAESSDLGADAVAAVDRLRARAMRLSLLAAADVCSHAALVRLRPDYLTLPEALIGGVSSDPDHQMVVESVVQLGWKLGTQVIATGVRNAADVAMLRRAGVTLASGALLCGPQLLGHLTGCQPARAALARFEPEGI